MNLNTNKKERFYKLQPGDVFTSSELPIGMPMIILEITQEKTHWWKPKRYLYKIEFIGNSINEGINYTEKIINPEGMDFYNEN